MKVLIIQNVITHYNEALYNALANESNINLTIAHGGARRQDKNIIYDEINFTFFDFSGFTIIKDKIYNICQDFDVVIAMSDIRWLSLVSLSFWKRRKFRLVYWGIGTSASYKTKLDSNRKWDIIRYFMARKADAMLFYSSYPIDKYVNAGIVKEKLFVAHNTLEENISFNYNKNKNKLIFIGTLYKEKGIFELLNAYLKSNVCNVLELNIIGDGDEKDNIIEFISKNKLENSVFVRGAIYDKKELFNYFNDSIACISPSQAGLSVLKSMANGVPFITKKDAITGGEIFNIEHNQNGVLYTDENDLVSICEEILENPIKYIELGENAKKYYAKNRQIVDMKKSFIEAINYSLN